MFIRLKTGIINNHFIIAALSFMLIFLLGITSCKDSSTNNNELNNTQNISNRGLIRSKDSNTSTPPSGKRFALLIGNSDYKENNAKLGENPLNDAKDLGKVLEELGFDTTVLLNADRDKMLQGLNTLKKKLIKHPKSTVLYYFAGHGVQLKGKNYLLPVGVDYSDQDTVMDAALPANEVLRRIGKADPAVSLVILDACRNNPYEKLWKQNSRALQTSSGLAKMRAPSGFLIAYATEPGGIAANGEGKNGLYTSALLKYLPTKGITIYEVFSRVRTDVEEQSNKIGWSQRPREEIALKGKPLCMVSCPTSV